MQAFRVTLIPQTAFATPLKGDTLFGQLCWTIRHQLGAARLTELLAGYTNGQPFAVVSDAFPAGYLPMPLLPRHFWQLSEARNDPSARKALKKRQWLPLAALAHPLPDWLENHAKADVLPMMTGNAPHNTLNRATGTTGKGEFAPYTVEQFWHVPGQALTAYLLLDEQRLAASECEALWHAIGTSGFGRDASTGLGKFTVAHFQAGWEAPAVANANAWLTLAPCAPQGLAWQEARCFYQPFTRFGRHGDLAATTGQPWKTPLLLADSAAVLTPASYEPRALTGQGLGGNGSLSRALPETVHQGYAPVIGVHLPEGKS